jgi:hypothetical protein
MAYFVRIDYCNYELNVKLPIILSYEIYVFYSIIKGTCPLVRHYKIDKFSIEAIHVFSMHVLTHLLDISSSRCTKCLFHSYKKT